MKEGEFPRRMDLQLYPHMINITQGGLCTGSSMSNYGPTVSDWEQTSCQRLPGEELHRHGTQALHVGAGWCHHRPDFMTLSPQLIEQVRLFSMVRPAGNKPSRNSAGIWDSASINANRGEAYSLFYFHVFKATHVAKHITIPMTSLMIFTVCRHLLYCEEQMQIHHPPPL